MLKITAHVLVLTVFVAATTRANLALHQFPPPQNCTSDRSSVSTGPLKLIGVTQPSLTSDWLYLAAISYFGHRSTRPTDYLLLAPLLQQSLAWDPFHLGPYIVAGTALNLKGMDNDAGILMLAQGAERLPDVWQIQFLLGTHKYFQNPADHDAAIALANAARLPGSPSYLGPLAARIAANAGDPILGLDLLEALSRQTEDLQLQATYAERARQLREQAATNPILDLP